LSGNLYNEPETVAALQEHKVQVHAIEIIANSMHDHTNLQNVVTSTNGIIERLLPDDDREFVLNGFFETVRSVVQVNGISTSKYRHVG